MPVAEKCVWGGHTPLLPAWLPDYILYSRDAIMLTKSKGNTSCSDHLVDLKQMPANWRKVAPSLGRHPSSNSSFILISTAHLRPGTIPVLSRAANKQNVLMTVSLHWFQGWRIWGLWGLTNNLQKKVPWPIIWWVNGRAKCWSNKPDKGRMILGCSCLCVIASSQFVTKWCRSLNYSPVRWGSKAN